MKQKVYIIKAGNFYKIGISNDVKQRLRSIQTANAQKCTIIATLDCDDAHAKEQKIHRSLSDFRTNGEWFMLNDRKLKAVIDYYDFNVAKPKKQRKIVTSIQKDNSTNVPPRNYNLRDAHKTQYNGLEPTFDDYKKRFPQYLVGNYQRPKRTMTLALVKQDLIGYCKQQAFYSRRKIKTYDERELYHIDINFESGFYEAGSIEVFNMIHSGTGKQVSEFKRHKAVMKLSKYNEKELLIMFCLKSHNMRGSSYTDSDYIVTLGHDLRLSFRYIVSDMKFLESKIELVTFL